MLSWEPGPYSWQASSTQQVEPDWSAAAFILAAAQITDCPIIVRGLPRPEQSLQGDSVFAHFLQTLDGPGPYEFDLTEAPDLIAPLAVVAVFAKSRTRIVGAAHTRVKESDRIAVLCREFRRVGVEIREHPDGLTIVPGGVLLQEPITLQPEGDHRMAMAFGLLSLHSPQLTVAEPDCVGKSYPGFWHDLEQIRKTVARVGR